MTRRLARIAVPLLTLAAAAACSRGDAEAKEAAPPAASAEAQAASSAPPAQPSAAPACEPGNGGITLPAGFCATVFADGLAGPRHIVAALNGDVYVALEGSRGGGDGGVMALRDTNGDGKADVKQHFGDTGGTGIALAGRELYFAPNDRVLRYTLPAGQLTPGGQPTTIVSGLPTGGHTAKTIALDGRGGLFVNVGSRTNSCQERDRQAQSKGTDPCPELATRAGIWRFAAARAGQTQQAGTRFATGIRNAVAISFGPGGALYVVQHGRDQLGDWPGFTAGDNAEKPGEEFLRVSQGDDFGWPYCFFDPTAGKKVLAPEFGGDGRQVGRCATKKNPLMAFPGHWAPESIVFYGGGQFPARYRGGAFIAFHGSWNRAPLPQAGYQVVFVPFQNGAPSARYEAFATGFAGAQPNPGAAHRPMGLAVAPDGSLYVTDDSGGRIWRVYYRGGR